MPSSIKNHHLFANPSLTSQLMGSQGVVPQTLSSLDVMSAMNSFSFIAPVLFSRRSRNEGQGSMSMYGLCGMTCCCSVGEMDAGIVPKGAMMLNPDSWWQARDSSLAMQQKAAAAVEPGMAMKYVSAVRLDDEALSAVPEGSKRPIS